MQKTLQMIRARTASLRQLNKQPTQVESQRIKRRRRNRKLKKMLLSRKKRNRKMMMRQWMPRLLRRLLSKRSNKNNKIVDRAITRPTWLRRWKQKRKKEVQRRIKSTELRNSIDFFSICVFSNLVKDWRGRHRCLLFFWWLVFNEGNNSRIKFNIWIQPCLSKFIILTETVWHSLINEKWKVNSRFVIAHFKFDKEYYSISINANSNEYFENLKLIS